MTTSSIPLEESQVLPFAVASVIILLSTAYYFASRSKSRTTGTSASDDQKSSAARNTKETPSSGPDQTPTTTHNNGGLKNVWDAPRNTPSLVGKKDYGEEKPFGSKYYYAHNNSKATGGYKDGLKMEDYTMNGPRLLSKDGKPVTGAPVESSSTLGPPDESKSVATKTSIQFADPRFIPITKYLWDDPGDSKGIATIRIDSLPTKSGSMPPMVNYSDIAIGDISAKLAGEGLLVQLTEDSTSSASEPRRYQLKIPKLYGDAASVKVVRKTKRLLVKIQKKQRSVFSSNKSNMDAWPQPHRKI